MKNLKQILLVEDSAKDRELVIGVLEDNKIANKIDIAIDGEEALNYLYKKGKYKNRKTNNPCVVLLDIKMPKVDGLEVLRQIKGDKKLKIIPVVVLTSSREETDMVKSYKLGVNAYVVKPVEFNDFFRAVKELGIFWAIINETPCAQIF